MKDNYERNHDVTLKGAQSNYQSVESEGNVEAPEGDVDTSGIEKGAAEDVDIEVRKGSSYKERKQPTVTGILEKQSLGGSEKIIAF